MSQTTERAFETYVETLLHGHAGWQAGTTAEWDMDRALFPARVFAFLQETQPKLCGRSFATSGRFLRPHLPLARDASIVKVGEEVELQLTASSTAS